MSKLRYPAVPLITVDPHLNIWSCTDNLYDDVTRHWTGRRHNFLGIIEIDEKPYRFMGKVNADNAYQYELPVINQTDVTVYPMRTVYTFENAEVNLELTFMTPLLTDDLKLMSRPVSYISYKVTALDGNEHKVKLFFALDCQNAVHTADQEVTLDVYENGAFCGRGDKDMLTKSGDDMNIDWGWLHIYSACGFTPSISGAGDICRRYRMRCRDNYDSVAPGDTLSLDRQIVYISLEKEDQLTSDGIDGYICVAYDDIHSIMYFGEMIDAYYKKDGDSFNGICKKAIDEYEDICNRVIKAENELLKKAAEYGEKYIDIISLAYRQAIAAHKLTWDGEEIQFLSKECYSNGCIGTLDVTYPSIPLFLMTEPKLVEGMMNPLMKYSYSKEWPFDFAPHDVGQYPIANGQVYGKNHETDEQRLEMQMPVEECGNALLTILAICMYENDMSYFNKHKDILAQWTTYLIKYGLDPENQLCTDDFAGHLAHNCNLSVKAIMGIAAYGMMLDKTGEDGSEYTAKAKDYAAQWKITAFDGDHYRLAFDKEDTWSIKYNMVWDKIFDMGIFDKDIFETETAYYMTRFNKYGLPLDSRSDYTKSDWLLWTTRLTDNKEYFDKIVSTMWDMLNETQSRVPFTDWYFTSTAIQRGFQNRTVQGGLFIPMI